MRRVAVAHTARDDAGVEVRGGLVEQAGERRVHERDLDVLTVAVALAGPQGGQDAVRREEAADHVDERRADLQRAPVGLAGHRHQAALGLHLQVVGGRPSGLVADPKAEIEQHHHVGVGPASRRRRGPGGRSPAGTTPPRRRRGCAAAGERHVAGVLAVQRHRALVAVELDVVGRASCTTGGPHARVSSPLSGHSTLITSAPRSPRPSCTSARPAPAKGRRRGSHRERGRPRPRTVACTPHAHPRDLRPPPRGPQRRRRPAPARGPERPPRRPRRRRPARRPRGHPRAPPPARCTTRSRRRDPSSRPSARPSGPDGEVVLVPGNHDFRLIAPWLDWRARNGPEPLGLQERAGPRRRSGRAP